MYVIVKGNKYVAQPGSNHSYTTKLDRAERFRTEEEARKHKCGNESVIDLYGEMLGWRR
jgi:hypothetical protein